MDLNQFKSEIIPLRQKLYHFAWKLLENEADAEDAVQETFLRLWNNRDKLDNINNSGAFAMQTVKNICIDKIRARRFELSTEETPDPDVWQQTPYADMEQKDSVQLIRGIIERLPELQRKIILMRDVEGYELQEIATITGTHVSAVTMNLSRARKKVREEFITVHTYKAMVKNEK